MKWLFFPFSVVYYYWWYNRDDYMLIEFGKITFQDAREIVYKRYVGITPVYNSEGKRVNRRRK